MKKSIAALSVLLFAVGCSGPPVAYETSFYGIGVAEGLSETFYAPAQVDLLVYTLINDLVREQGYLEAELVAVAGSAEVEVADFGGHGQRHGRRLLVSSEHCPWASQLKHQFMHLVLEELDGNADDNHARLDVWELADRHYGGCNGIPPPGHPG